jgi:hypothetical protein
MKGVRLTLNDSDYEYFPPKPGPPHRRPRSNSAMTRTPAPDFETPMSAEQAALLKQISRDACKSETFKLDFTRAEVEQRIAPLSAKIRLLELPPHML